MSLWSRITNAFSRNRVNREIEEELQSHIGEAIAEGRHPGAVRRAFGPILHHRETSRDIRIVPWLEPLYADTVFGWRQLLKRKVTSSAAVLSLALAIGSCGAAFRMIDATLWRPLPVAAPERLYILSGQSAGADGKRSSNDNWAYPMFRQMRTLVKDRAELIAVSNGDRIDLTYGSDEETEKAYRQYVSGWMFDAFGILPALESIRLSAWPRDPLPAPNPESLRTSSYPQ